MDSFYSCTTTVEGVTCDSHIWGTNSGTVRFEVGEYVKTITIAAFNDDVYDVVPVYMNLSLTAASQSQLGTTKCDVVFVDNGDAGLVGFEEEQITVMETVGTTDIRLWRSAGFSGQVTVTVTSTINSAVEGNRVHEVVTFENGSSGAILSITIRDSNEFEARRLVLMLSNPTSGVAVNGQNLTLTIEDKGDVSLPGRGFVVPGVITGGCIGFVMQPPVFMGGGTALALLLGFKLILADTKTGSLLQFTVATETIDVCDLDYNTTYTASVAAINQRGQGEFDTAEVSTGSITAPSGVVGLIVDEITGGFARLWWEMPLDKGGIPIKAYKLELLNLATNEVRTQQIPGSVLAVSASFLTSYTTYRFSVWAVNEVDMEGSMAVLDAETSYATPPQQPLEPELIQATGGALHFEIMAPMDCGGSQLVSYTLSIARNTGGDLIYQEHYPTGSLGLSYDGRVGNTSVYGLMSNAAYVVKVAMLNEQVPCFSATLLFLI
ncbi:hypothetical protein BBJ28_00005224 [Nothophytophthora sp. Chile5]|nr:hypothetical protein BBJ28_00005224 [Nothophytophthora sp. Chile5]